MIVEGTPEDSLGLCNRGSVRRKFKQWSKVYLKNDNSTNSEILKIQYTWIMKRTQKSEHQNQYTLV
jgi:hypothetical protein